ncbi:hypothetical protein H5410_000855 [Solanum commersonii]|uniref:DUF4216 domain-containing protein n=1 Tax=Solanum commersonii TaxID=4109 RepID=A0A9J6AXX4_SOLCO|nr:hypothetical protein H5410_000855 [Solanum commersonii]
MDVRVVLFRCNWFDVCDEIKGVKKDDDQASQVFYANDHSNKGWQVVRKTQPRDSYEILEQMDDDIVELGSPSQKKLQDETIEDRKEVDSSMKSTIRYTFVATGAIGKGRGQGLKSLAERRDLSTKSFVSQSSDPLMSTCKKLKQPLLFLTTSCSQKEYSKVLQKGRDKDLKALLCVLVKEWE